MNIVLFIIGLLLTVFSHPKVLGPVMHRLSNEKIITQKNLKPEDVQIIKHTGPNFTIFAIGVVFILLSFII